MHIYLIYFESQRGPASSLGKHFRSFTSALWSHSVIACSSSIANDLLGWLITSWTRSPSAERFGPALLRGTWPSQSFQYLGKRNITGVIFGRLELEIGPTWNV